MKGKSAGFTLIELLVVIVIIVGLMSGLVVYLIGVLDNAKDARVRALIKQLETGCSLYKTEFGVYPGAPTNQSGSRVLHQLLGSPWKKVTSFNSDGTAAAVVDGAPFIPSFSKSDLRNPNADPATSPTELIDPWRNAIQYRSVPVRNLKSVDIWSWGKDKRDGTEDDLTNWQQD